MLYNLSQPSDKKHFRARAYKLYRDGETVDLTVKKDIIYSDNEDDDERTRTLKQNRYLHLILGWFAKKYGATKDYVKLEYFKKTCNRDIFVETEYDKLIKKQVEIVRSSAVIDVEQMKIAIERFRNWSASEANIYLPDREEQEFLKNIEIELKKYKIWI